MILAHLYITLNGQTQLQSHMISLLNYSDQRLSRTSAASTANIPLVITGATKRTEEFCGGHFLSTLYILDDTAFSRYNDAAGKPVVMRTRYLMFLFLWDLARHHFPFQFRLDYSHPHDNPRSGQFIFSVLAGAVGATLGLYSLLLIGFGFGYGVMTVYITFTLNGNTDRSPRLNIITMDIICSE